MGTTIIKNGKILLGESYVNGNIEIIEGKITRIGSFENEASNIEVIDANGNTIVPGFIDIHTHGGNGIDINHASKEEIKELSKFFARKGVTSFLPTILTDTHEKMCELLGEIADAKEEGTEGSEILGIHMEGPFLCTEFKGAMPEHLIQDASIKNVQEYEKASRNNIKYMTVSVENKGVEELIAYLKSKNIVASMGHTGAEYGQCLRCIKAGVTSSTHLFNAMGTLHQHRPSAIGAALETDIYSEIISDGFHLHPGIVRLIIKTKGEDKVIGITDSIMAAGLEDGKYMLGVNDIVVENGDAKLASDGTRAGSTLTMDKALRNLMKFTNKPLEYVISFLTKNPAKVIGVAESKGEIGIGMDGDLVILDNDYTVIYTLVRGSIVYKK